MTVSLEQLPIAAAQAWARFRDEARTVLGNDLTALWGYGGTIFLDRPRRLGDLDTVAILERVPDERTTRTLERVRDEIAREHGIEWDVWYILTTDAALSDPPPDALDPDSRLTAWAIDRAHWHAGCYVHLFGRRPEETVPAPSWPEIEAALSRELEHLERHAEEGENDPSEATYAIWNGSRILCAIETGNVAVSKRTGGRWALDHLPEEWHDAVRAADRAYDGEATPRDEEVLRETMAAFVAMVRERLPVADARPAGSRPRWSGC